MFDKESDRIWEKYEKSIIVESVSFHVADTGDNEPQTVLDVCFAVQKDFLFNFLKNSKITPKKVSGLDMLTSDGGDFDKSVGVINFYVSDIPEELKNKAISGVKYHIGNYAKLLGEPIEERSKIYDSLVVRFKISIDQKQNKSPEMNWSNMNAALILKDVLNYPDDVIYNSEPLDVRELLMKIENVEDNDFIINKAERKYSQEGNHYITGLSKEDIKGRLSQLKKMCEWAIENDYSKINLS